MPRLDYKYLFFNKMYYQLRILLGREHFANMTNTLVDMVFFGLLWYKVRAWRRSHRRQRIRNQEPHRGEA